MPRNEPNETLIKCDEYAKYLRAQRHSLNSPKPDNATQKKFSPVHVLLSKRKAIKIIIYSIVGQISQGKDPKQAWWHMGESLVGAWRGRGPPYGGGGGGCGESVVVPEDGPVLEYCHQSYSMVFPVKRLKNPSCVPPRRALSYAITRPFLTFCSIHRRKWAARRGVFV